MIVGEDEGFYYKDENGFYLVFFILRLLFYIMIEIILCWFCDIFCLVES